MSVVFPQFLWMACGAKSEFKMGKLLPIQNRKIIAYPDCEMQKNGTSTYDEWKQKAEEMNNSIDKDSNAYLSSMLINLLY